MRRRPLLALAALVLLPTLGLPAWIALNRSDLPEPDDADLLIEVPEVPEEDDAFAWFRKAAAAMVWNDSKASDERLRSIRLRETSEPSELEWIEAMMRVNDRAFLLLEAGLAAPGIVIPPWTLDDMQDAAGTFDVVLPIQTLVRLSAAHARNLAERGRPMQAIESAILGMRVGRKLAEARAPQLVSMMMVVGIQGISLVEIERLLPDARLSASQARELAGRLDGWRWDEDAWRRAWSAEYAWIKEVSAGLEADSNDADWDLGEKASLDEWITYELLPADYAFQMNRTLSLSADMYRELSDASQRPCQATWSHPAPAMSDWWKLPTVLAPNPVGRILIEIARPNFTSFDLKRCHLATRISLVQARLALHAYQHEHGSLPERLEELVPDYLDAVPEDRFDGEPIRWSRERGVLYSVGDDFADDGPPEAPSQVDAGQPAMSVALTPPRRSA
jgi:hypothetical protein